MTDRASLRAALAGGAEFDDMTIITVRMGDLRALLADYDRMRDALELFLAHSPEPECAIWRHVHDVARAALAQEGS